MRLGFLLLWVSVSIDPAWAQLNLLTLSEAETLAERIPAVAAAERNGECPTLSPSYDGRDSVWFQVRLQCGPNAGQLLGNYNVNRRTGATTTWGDNPRPVDDAEGRRFASELIKTARQRILSPVEAQCLALEAAKALPGWGAPNSSVSVRPFGKEDLFAGTMQFSATQFSALRSVESVRTLTVFLNEARVRDDHTGADLFSAALGNITSTLVALRAPPSLSDEEVASVALAIPQVAINLRRGCKLRVGGGFPSDRVEMVLFCADSTDRMSVAIDRKTGTATDLNTRKSLDSAESQRVARQLLSDVRTRAVSLRMEIDAMCRQ